MRVDAARTSVGARVALAERTASRTEALDLPYDEILRATQWWLLYGTVGFAVLCIVIGAVESLFGR